jgi:hypothetical protein
VRASPPRRVLREDASRQSSALKLHQTSGLRCPHRVEPALAFASRTGDRAQTRGLPRGHRAPCECGYSMPSRAMLKAIDAFRDQQKASAPARPRRGRRSATRPSSLRAAFRLVPRLVTLREQQRPVVTYPSADRVPSNRRAGSAACCRLRRAARALRRTWRLGQRHGHGCQA